jgi:hypothetical protein
VLAVWLVKPDIGPERVMIIWPDKLTAVSPSKVLRGNRADHASAGQQFH